MLFLQHTALDGIVSVDATMFSLNVAKNRSWNQAIVRETANDTNLVKELCIETDDFIEREIIKAKEEFLTRASDLKGHLHAFGKFGKARIKDMKIHPDTFIQVCIQVAAYKSHGRYTFIISVLTNI